MAVSFSLKKEKDDFAGPIIALLTIIKVGNLEWYNSYLSGNMTARNLFEKLQEIDSQNELRFSSIGAYIFAILSYTKNPKRSTLSNDYTQYKHKISNKTNQEIKNSSESEFAKSFINAYDGLRNSTRNWNLNDIRGRIELASRFN